MWIVVVQRQPNAEDPQLPPTPIYYAAELNQLLGATRLQAGPFLSESEAWSHIDLLGA